MDKQAIKDQCDQMTDVELVRALTYDKGEYTESFHEIAKEMLAQKGISLSDWIDRVAVGSNQQETETVSVEAALGKLEQLSEWETCFFTNCLEETIMVQKATLCWATLHDLPDRENHFAVIQSQNQVMLILNQFLTLAEWEAALKPFSALEEWQELTGSVSMTFCQNLAMTLADYNVPAYILTEHLRTLLADKALKTITDPFSLLIPTERFEVADKVLSDLEERIEWLYEQAESMGEASQDPEKELEIYTELAQWVPQDETVHYNRGVLLFDAGDLEGAAESFMAATFNVTDEEIKDEAENYLRQIIEERPEDLAILHTLASLAMEKSNTSDIEAFYQKIIAIDPDDTLAHLNLGHLYYAHSDDNEKPRQHFETYLKLNPDADDRDVILEILDNLSQ